MAGFAADPAPKSGSGHISVTTQPAGATIYVDGQMMGKSPGEIEGLAAGRYFLRFELDGFRPADLVVELSNGQSYQTGPVELISNSAPARRVESMPPPPPPPPAPRAAPATPNPATPVPRAPLPATPIPTTPVPAPARTIAPPTPLPTPTEVLMTPPAAAPDAAAEEETIQKLVAAHLKSIADGDIDAYLALCATKVDLYDEGLQSHDSIRKSRQKLKERWPKYEISNVRDLNVRPGDKPDVRRAAVTYDWNVSNSKTGKSASGTASDILDFKLTNGQWLIVKARQNVERSSKKRGQ